MAFSDIIPWRGRRQLARREDPMRDPFDYLQEQINRMFEEPLSGSRRGFPMETGGFAPPVEINDSETEVRISAELPGIDSKDLDIHVTQDAVTIRGEKRHERRVEERGGQWTERSYGAFERIIPLPAEVKGEEAKAQFKNGVLEITLPKREEAKSRAHKVQIE